MRSQFTPFRGPASSLALFDLKTICSPPRSMWDITIYPISGPMFSSPINVGHHNPPLSGPSVLVGTLCPQIHPSLGLSVLTGTPPPPANVGHHNPLLSVPSVLAGTLSFLQSMWDSFLPPINVGLPPNPPPLEPSVLTGTPPRVYPPSWNSEKADLQSMWDITIHPLWGPVSLLAHRLVSTPFVEQREGWHIVRCLALIPFVTTQIHR